MLGTCRCRAHTCDLSYVVHVVAGGRGPSGPERGQEHLLKPGRGRLNSTQATVCWPEARPASRLGEVVQRIRVQFVFVFLIIFGCAGPLLLRGVFLAAASRGLLSGCGRLAPRGGCSCRGAQVLGHVSSAAAAPGLQAQARQLWHTALAALQHVGLPRPRIKHMSPALAGRVFTPELPGKPCVQF